MFSPFVRITCVVYLPCWSSGVSSFMCRTGQLALLGSSAVLCSQVNVIWCKRYFEILMRVFD